MWIKKSVCSNFHFMGSPTHMKQELKEPDSPKAGARLWPIYINCVLGRKFWNFIFVVSEGGKNREDDCTNWNPSKRFRVLGFTLLLMILSVRYFSYRTISSYNIVNNVDGNNTQEGSNLASSSCSSIPIVIESCKAIWGLLKNLNIWVQNREFLAYLHYSWPPKREHIVRVRFILCFEY